MSHAVSMKKTPPRHPRDLTDEQWEILEPFLPVPTRREDGRGRPPGKRAVRFSMESCGCYAQGLPGPTYPTAIPRIRRAIDGKGTKIMAIADSRGLPVAMHVESATPHEVTLVNATLATRFVKKVPVRLIGDKAYDSHKLDEELAQRGVVLIAPHRSNRKRKTQDGRPLRRYRRRWKVERLFAWLQNFRRIVVRYERSPENFLGMLH